MPRSSGGRRGSFSPASSHSDTITKNVAISKGLSSASKTIELLSRDSRSCQVVFDVYEECMTKKAPLYGASTCDFYNEVKASCSRFKRDPHHRNTYERHKAEWQQKTLRRANAAGFATIDEYFRAQDEKDPRKCRIRYELYNKCILKYPDNKATCDYYRNKCKQFQKPGI